MTRRTRIWWTLGVVGWAVLATAPAHAEPATLRLSTGPTLAAWRVDRRFADDEALRNLRLHASGAMVGFAAEALVQADHVRMGFRSALFDARSLRSTPTVVNDDLHLRYHAAVGFRLELVFGYFLPGRFSPHADVQVGFAMPLGWMDRWSNAKGVMSDLAGNEAFFVLTPRLGAAYALTDALFVDVAATFSVLGPESVGGQLALGYTVRSEGSRRGAPAGPPAGPLERGAP